MMPEIYKIKRDRGMGLFSMGLLSGLIWGNDTIFSILIILFYTDYSMYMHRRFYKFFSGEKDCDTSIPNKLFNQSRSCHLHHFSCS